MIAKKKKGSSPWSSLRTKAQKPVPRHPPKTKKRSPRDAEKLADQLEARNQELREKQREIVEAGKRYLDLYDLAPIGYFDFDQKGTILDLNHPGAKLLGRPKNQLIGTPFAFFLSQEFTHEFYQHLKKVFSDNAKETCELKISPRYRKDVIYVSLESVALNTDEGMTCRSAVIDITKADSAEKELINARDELAERNAQLRRLSARLLETHEEERNRVASDVHDSFASQLCVIKNELQSLFGKGGNNRLTHIINLLNVAIRDARRIQTALRPAVLDLGLIPAMNMLCREFQNRHSHIHLEKHLLLEEDKVPDSLKVPIFRIAQDAFDNIATHSRADSVTISLTRRDSFIEFFMKDNGQGFDVEEILTNGTGRGLLTMRQRALASDGLFNIESEPGNGTTLRASWPFT